MNVNEILAEVRKEKETRFSWRKMYDNGTELWEWEITTSRRMRKPIAHLQIGFHSGTKEVIGATISTYKNFTNHEYEVEKLEDVKKILETIHLLM